MPLLCALLFATALSAPPRVINHPPIPLKANAAAFALTGCKDTCDKGPLAGLCDRITIDDDLGGLGLPTARCWKYNRGPMLPPTEYIQGPQGMMQIYERMVVLENAHYRVLKTKSDLYASFKPVMSEQQALSTATAVTGFRAAYGLKAIPGFRYFVPTIEDTYVTHGDHDDFIVHNLQSYAVFGCGPHSTFLITLRVPRVGEVTTISDVKAFEDPKQDGLCVD